MLSFHFLQEVLHHSNVLKKKKSYNFFLNNSTAHKLLFQKCMGNIAVQLKSHRKVK